jgi:hypothetical protein
VVCFGVGKGRGEIRKGIIVKNIRSREGEGIKNGGHGRRKVVGEEL